MRGLIHIGTQNFSGGRLGDAASLGLSEDLKRLGFPLGRLKTGTPARLLASSIDFSVMEEQPGDHNVCFVHRNEMFVPTLPQVSCHITHTTDQTKDLITKICIVPLCMEGESKELGHDIAPLLRIKS